MLRNYGQRDRYNASLDGGLNSRLDEVQAAILAVRLKRVDAWNKERTRLVNVYRAALADMPLHFQRTASGSSPAWHLAVVAVDSELTRDRLRTYLEAAGIQTLIHYPTPTHEQKAFERYKRQPLPHTESLARRIVSLPLYVGLAEAEQGAVVDAIRSFFR
jgi:dTDP-4-amino-4,6-dideoxygalactose transaminase